jgi:hypothetical protein
LASPIAVHELRREYGTRSARVERAPPKFRTKRQKLVKDFTMCARGGVAVDVRWIPEAITWPVGPRAPAPTRAATRTTTSPCA